MIPPAAEGEKHRAVEIVAPLQSWALMESFKSCQLFLVSCANKENKLVAFCFYKTVNSPNCQQGKVPKAYASENTGVWAQLRRGAIRRRGMEVSLKKKKGRGNHSRCFKIPD